MSPLISVSGNVYLSPMHRSGLFVLLAWSIVGSLLYYAYTSSLVAGLTLPVLDHPPDTWPGLVDSDYIIRVAGNYAKSKLQVCSDYNCSATARLNNVVLHAEIHS